jgi:hypothetical protein
MQHHKAVALREVPTTDLMCELTRRAIAGDKAADAPRSLLKLICTMVSVLGIRQSFVFSEELRSAADELENSTGCVHV